MAIGLLTLFLCLFLLPLFADREIQYFCPEYVITTRQYLKSPSYPKYFPLVRCWYNISAPKEFVAVISFKDFDFPLPDLIGAANIQLIKYQDCRTDYIEIYTGIGAGSRFCGKELKDTKIYSETGKLEIIFQSRTRRESGGFSASVDFLPILKFYTENYCNSLLEERISRHYVINALPTGKNCKFVVKAPEGKRPEVKFFVQNNSPCLRYRAYDEHYGGTDSTDMSTCDTKWIGKAAEFSYRKFGIEILGKRDPVNVRVQVRYQSLEDACAKYLKNKYTGFQISFRHQPQPEEQFPSICIWLIQVPNTSREVSFNYNMDLLDAEEGYCNRDQLVFAEVFDNYTRNVFTPEPNCGKLQDQNLKLNNSNYNDNLTTTMMVMVAFDNEVKKFRSFNVTISF